MSFPISGGNFYALSKYLEAMNNSQSDDWRFYLLQRDYFANEFIVEGDDELEGIWNTLTPLLQDLGKIAVVRIGTELSVCGIEEVELYQDGRTKRGKGYKLAALWNYKSADLGKKITLTETNSVVMILNDNALSLWWTIRPVIETMKFYLTLNKTNALVGMSKKLKINLQNNNDALIKEEIDSIMNPAIPYIKNIISPQSYFGNNNLGSGGEGLTEAGMSQPNRIEEFLSGSKAGQVLEGWDVFERALGFWYRHLGRNTNSNTDKKKERLITGENDASNAELIVVSQARKKFMERFVVLYNKTFNKNITIEFLAEIQLETSGNIEGGGLNDDTTAKV